jgi:4-deoxy-L-threo-5-hexosulose-uronate ketol-isomerase
MAIEIRQAVSPREAKGFDTAQLRGEFLVEDLFAANDIRLTYTLYDRLIVGGVMPVEREVFLPVVRETGTENFLDRREMIVVNIGGEGQVVTLTGTYNLARRDMLYLGRGIGPVSFGSREPGRPAKYFVASAPAHKELPARLVRSADARRTDTGDPAMANQRVVFDYIHADQVETCQLVAGITILAEASVWNASAGNLHPHRTEAAFYFAMRPEQRIFHVMGEPSETRHLMVANEQAVISPAWSVQASFGTQNYAFVWVTAGDNVDEHDIEPVPLHALR